MKPGGGKIKGGNFERSIAKHLSLWYSQGKREDLFWRSSMSGGRATVSKIKLSAVAGDICATAGEGAGFTDKWYIECKHVANLNLQSWLLKKAGPIAGWWTTAVLRSNTHNKYPMLILKQNLLDTMVVARLTHIGIGWQDFCPDPLLILQDDTSLGNEMGLYWFKELFPMPEKTRAPRPRIRP